MPDRRDEDDTVSQIDESDFIPPSYRLYRRSDAGAKRFVGIVVVVASEGLTMKFRHAGCRTVHQVPVEDWKKMELEPTTNFVPTLEPAR